MSNLHIHGPTLRWRKSSRSSGTGAECVEVAGLTDGTAVRDSKNPAGPALSFSAEAWRVFAGRVKAGEHDL